MQHVRVGSDIEFVCEAESSTVSWRRVATSRTPDEPRVDHSSLLPQDDFDLTWERLGNDLPERAFISNGSLRINNVQAQDGGLYLCIGRDGFDGVNRAAAHLIITGQG